MIFTDDHAERMKERAGQPFRPSNGFEGDLFQERQCLGCVHGPECEIVLRTMVFDAGDESYPPEWVIGDDGQPKCTAFELTPDDQIISVYIVATTDGKVAFDDLEEANDLAREHNTTTIKTIRMLRSRFNSLPDHQ